MITPNEFIQAKFYSPGRTYKGQTFKPVMIVEHWMDTTLEGADNVFLGKTSRQVSAHFGIGKDGTIHQYVDVNDTAWGAGDWYVNLQSINIEHEGQPGVAITDECYIASMKLQAQLCQEFGIDPKGMLNVRTNNGARTFNTLCPHDEVVATSCPGTLDLGRLRNGVASVLSLVGVDQPVNTSGTTGTTTVYQVPLEFTVTTLYRANFRTEPHLTAHIAATYSAGTTIDCISTVEGDTVTVNGITTNKWYKSSLHGFYISAAVARHN